MHRIACSKGCHAEAESKRSHHRKSQEQDNHRKTTDWARYHHALKRKPQCRALKAPDNRALDCMRYSVRGHRLWCKWWLYSADAPPLTAATTGRARGVDRIQRMKPKSKQQIATEQTNICYVSAGLRTRGKCTEVHSWSASGWGAFTGGRVKLPWRSIQPFVALGGHFSIP